MKKSKKGLFFISCITLILYFTGLYQYLFTVSYFRYYSHWGPEGSVEISIDALEKGQQVRIKSVGSFDYPFKLSYPERCQSLEEIRLLLVVKSALNNFAKRQAIRKTWGYENRFSDVVIRTIFLLGYLHGSPNEQQLVMKEAAAHKDIIQAEFEESYFNNTLKTMMGIQWAFKHCSNAKYFLFVDDDYYISTRNILRFIRSPSNYPSYLYSPAALPLLEQSDNLYAGYVFQNVSPIRWYFSKWYIPLDEYPYSHWPPYVTAGAYILPYKSLRKIYYASLYTYYFRFDDIFIGFAAKKAGIKPFHHSEFYFDLKPYSLDGYKWVIASHGYEDPAHMQETWDEQRSAGNA